MVGGVTMEQASGLDILSLIAALATFGATAFIIADGKGKEPMNWALFAIALAVVAFPVLLMTKNIRQPRVPYAAKATAVFAVGLCIQLVIAIAQIT